MKKGNVVRIDAKGRIIIPYHIRDYLGLKEGDELMLSNNEMREIRVMPLAEGAARVYVQIADRPGSLAKVAEIFARHKCDILMSASKTIERGALAELQALVDVSQCKDVERMKRELDASGVVRRIELEQFEN